MNNIQATKLTLQNEHGTYSVVIPGDATIEQMIDDLFIPVLLASGFSRETIDRAIGGDQ